MRGYYNPYIYDNISYIIENCYRPDERLLQPVHLCGLLSGPHGRRRRRRCSSTNRTGKEEQVKKDKIEKKPLDRTTCSYIEGNGGTAKTKKRRLGLCVPPTIVCLNMFFLWSRMSTFPTLKEMKIVGGRKCARSPPSHASASGGWIKVRKSEANLKALTTWASGAVTSPVWRFSQFVWIIPWIGGCIEQQNVSSDWSVVFSGDNLFAHWLLWRQNL